MANWLAVQGLAGALKRIYLENTFLEQVVSEQSFYAVSFDVRAKKLSTGDGMGRGRRGGFILTVSYRTRGEGGKDGPMVCCLASILPTLFITWASAHLTIPLIPHLITHLGLCAPRHPSMAAHISYVCTPADAHENSSRHCH
jgi:hypothetical protein